MRFPTINPWIAILCLPILMACGNLMDLVADPAVQDSLKMTAESAATGNWVGTLWGLGGTVAAVCAYKKIKKGSSSPKLEQT
jgi:TctA family transporter